MGLLYTGSRLFPMAWVTGYKRVPDPPARMIPLQLVLIEAFIMNGIFLLFRRDSRRRVMRFNPLPIAPTGHFADPLFVLQVPLHGLANSGFKCFQRTPAEFPLNLARVHGVTPVVARPVLHY